MTEAKKRAATTAAAVGNAGGATADDSVMPSTPKAGPAVCDALALVSASVSATASVLVAAASSAVTRKRSAAATEPDSEVTSPTPKIAKLAEPILPWSRAAFDSQLDEDSLEIPSYDFTSLCPSFIKDASVGTTGTGLIMQWASGGLLDLGGHASVEAPAPMPTADHPFPFEDWEVALDTPASLLEVVGA